MRLPHFRRRAGTTLIELIIYMAIIAIVGIAILPLLFNAAEDRILQQTVSVVEQNGAQILQTIGYRVRHAEKILDPFPSFSGSVLALQTGSGGIDPIIFGVSSGSLVQVRRTVQEIISSQQVSVQNFQVINTSSTGTGQSVLVRFRVSRTIRLQAPRSYSRVFQGLFTLLPDDEREGNACGCAVPGCGGGNTYVWQICEESACLTSQTQMQCP